MPAGSRGVLAVTFEKTDAEKSGVMRSVVGGSDAAGRIMLYRLLDMLDMLGLAKMGDSTKVTRDSWRVVMGAERLCYPRGQLKFLAGNGRIFGQLPPQH